ncbi:MAG: 2-hydroxyacid dehydrogenase [Devosiaceae bacterium]|nr:2-hydroxyacid dehydrogenase [Devosiaceae bacterium MH13]
MAASLVVLDPLTSDRLTRFASHAPDDFTVSAAASRDRADQLEAIKSATFVVTADMAVDREMMELGHGNALKGVHKWGVGYDNIDTDAARDLGLRVLRTTGSNALPVAETAVSLMLAMQRGIVAGHMGMQAGEWAKWTVGPRCATQSGATVGLIGLGYIGKNTARLLKGFGCDVLYAKPNPLSADEEAELGVRRASIDEIITKADVVSLHCALTPETSRLIDSQAIARMKDGVLLVNTARGGIADEQAVADALISGKLRGAAFDVFDIEPIKPDNPLLAAPNAIVTPHIASMAANNYAPTVDRMMANLSALSRGEEPPELDRVV